MSSRRIHTHTSIQVNKLNVTTTKYRCRKVIIIQKLGDKLFGLPYNVHVRLSLGQVLTTRPKCCHICLTRRRKKTPLLSSNIAYYLLSLVLAYSLSLVLSFSRLFSLSVFCQRSFFVLTEECLIENQQLKEKTTKVVTKWRRVHATKLFSMCICVVDSL